MGAPGPERGGSGPAGSPVGSTRPARNGASLSGAPVAPARKLGPVAAGATFALITTPCASPVLFAVLAAAAAQMVPGLSVATMVCFAIGYTALVFVAGLGAGRASGRFGRHTAGLQAGAAALLFLGGLG